MAVAVGCKAPDRACQTVSGMARLQRRLWVRVSSVQRLTGWLTQRGKMHDEVAAVMQRCAGYVGGRWSGWVVKCSVNMCSLVLTRKIIHQWTTHKSILECSLLGQSARRLPDHTISMRSRTLLQAAASVLAVGVAGVSAADPTRTATFVGCYDTSSASFKAATFRAEHIKSLDDCLVCSCVSTAGSGVDDDVPGRQYRGGAESVERLRPIIRNDTWILGRVELDVSVHRDRAKRQGARRRESGRRVSRQHIDGEYSCMRRGNLLLIREGFAVDQPYGLVSCISSPNDSSGHTALTGTPIRVSVPDECFSHCSTAAAAAAAASARGAESWAYMVPLPSLDEYYCGCSDRYVDPGTTTKCGTGSWYVFGETAALHAITQ